MCNFINYERSVDRASVYYRFTTAVGGSIVGDVTVYALRFVENILLSYVRSFENPLKKIKIVQQFICHSELKTGFSSSQFSVFTERDKEREKRKLTLFHIEKIIIYYI